MSYTHVYTWRVDQLDLRNVRVFRELLYKWKITTKLRFKGGFYKLTIDSPTARGLHFAKGLYEGMVAVWALPIEKLTPAFFEQLTKDVGPPPIDHLTRP